MSEPVRMLDTDTVSYLIKGRHPSVTHRFAEYGFLGTCISACTVSELLYGLESRAPEDQLRKGILGFLERAAIIPWDRPAAEVHARIRYRLDRAGQTIGVMDQMIAAHTMALGLTLVTNNTRHYSRLEPDLMVENWTDRPNLAGYHAQPHHTFQPPCKRIAMPDSLFTIEEIPIPASLDGPEGADFIEMVEVRNAVEAETLGSWALAVTPEELLPVYRRQEYEPRRLFVARADGRIVGRSVLQWSIEEGTNVSWVFGEVLGTYRNQGIGTALFDEMERIALESGRTVLQTDVIHTGTSGGERIAPPTGFGDIPARDPGARFLRNRGYALEQIARISFLDLPVDSGHLAMHRQVAEAAAGADYGIVTWVGLTPERWRSDLAYLKNRMSVDEPAAGLEIDEETWDEARVVSHDEAEIAGGRPLLVVVAEHIPSGKLVGINELSVPADRTRPVGQEDTLVLAEHRGHRLGMLLKAANLQELAKLAPEAPMVFTFNAEENRPMLNVNEAVGFRAVGYDGAWKKMT